jgi:hypothetical protein
LEPDPFGLASTTVGTFNFEAIVNERQFFFSPKLHDPENLIPDVYLSKPLRLHKNGTGTASDITTSFPQFGTRAVPHGRGNDCCCAAPAGSERSNGSPSYHHERISRRDFHSHTRRTHVVQASTLDFPDGEMPLPGRDVAKVKRRY